MRDSLTYIATGLTDRRWCPDPRRGGGDVAGPSSSGIRQGDGNASHAPVDVGQHGGISNGRSRKCRGHSRSPGFPRSGLSSELHFFDDVVFRRMMTARRSPTLAAKRFWSSFPPTRFRFDRRSLLRPSLPALCARCWRTPNGTDPVWKDIRVLDPLLDGGAVLLLDVAASAGKYGRATERAARNLLEEGSYEAACSDAHRAADVSEVRRESFGSRSSWRRRGRVSFRGGPHRHLGRRSRSHETTVRGGGSVAQADIVKKMNDRSAASWSLGSAMFGPPPGARVCRAGYRVTGYDRIR